MRESQYQKAKTLFKEALVIAKKEGLRETEAKVLKGLALIREQE